MLHNDHRKVDKLFKDLEMTTTRGPSRRQEIFAEIDEALCMHADFEEKEVYPLIAESKSAKNIALEAVEEHLQLRRLLAELRDLDPQDERWMAKAQVLMEDVRHHVEEEEGEAFPEVRTSAGAETLRRLGEGYQVLMGQAQQKAESRLPAARTGSPNTTPQEAKQKKPRAKARKSKGSDKEKDVSGSMQNADE